MGALRNIWKTTSALGVRDQSAHEQKQIAILNKSLFCGAAASFGYVFLYLYAGSVHAALINGGFIGLYGVALFLNHKDRQRVARHVAMLSANAHMFALSTFVLGHASGVHRWYWMFIVVAFLVFTREQKKWTYGYALLSIALFTGIEHGYIDHNLEPVVSGGIQEVISVVSTVLTLLIITLIVDVFDRETESAEKALKKEHDRSENLLRNILPTSIADRLKGGRREPIADHFADVTVLFADIAGFTVMSQTLDPREVVEMLNDVFSEFDALAERYGLEKIKTIGDAYMVAGNLPNELEDHAAAIANMALDMRDVIERHRESSGRPLQIRIGINSGPVVAGVIGVKKFIYDLWGDTVNTASRMESHGVVGSIQVSESTYRRIHDQFVFEERGPIEVKGKGSMRTYLLTERKESPLRAAS